MLQRCVMRLVLSFFFQAEDGIRDWSVTGVQTCALPIYNPWFAARVPQTKDYRYAVANDRVLLVGTTRIVVGVFSDASASVGEGRSEERRVGKECRSPVLPEHQQKKCKRL